MTGKRFLFILRRPPDSGFRVAETLDMALTAAAFDQSVALLFLDDGVYPLRRGQCPAADCVPAFEVLGMYDINAVWVERESLEERGLAAADLVIPVELVGRAGIAALISGHDVVVTA